MVFPPVAIISLIFIVELISLFFISREAIKVISRLFFLLTKTQTGTIQLLAILFLPGTIIHELSHIFAAAALMVHYGDIEFMPEIQGDRIKLGTAQIGETDILRRMLIGIAPIIFGIGLLVSILLYFWNTFYQFGQVPIPQTLVLLLIVFILNNTMFSSPKDLEGALGAFVLIGSVIGALLLTGFTQPFTFLGSLINDNVLAFFSLVDIIMAIPIIIDLGLILIVNLLLRKKRF